MAHGNLRLIPIGTRFARLCVISDRVMMRSGKTVRSGYFCQCDCGIIRSYVSASLKNGNSKSCGCLKIETSRARLTSHGHASNNKSDIYRIWAGMISRCMRPSSSKAYKAYGGSGIRVCERWQKFENFLADMGERPAGKSIDRFPDGRGHYEPGNCRWATDQEQARNTRANVHIEHNGLRLTLIEWSEKTGVSSSSIKYRIKAGWPMSKIFTPGRQYLRAQTCSQPSKDGRDVSSSSSSAP